MFISDENYEKFLAEILDVSELKEEIVEKIEWLKGVAEQDQQPDDEFKTKYEELKAKYIERFCESGKKVEEEEDANQTSEDEEKTIDDLFE